MLASRFWSVVLCVLAGPVWFVVVFFALALLSLAADPYPNAGAGMAVFYGAICFSFLLWIASVALIQNARERKLQTVTDLYDSPAAV